MTGKVSSRDSTSWSVKTVSGVHPASCWEGTGSPYSASKGASAWNWLLPPRTRISEAVTRLTHEVVQHQAEGWDFTVLFVPCTSASWCSTMHILIQSSCIRTCFVGGHRRQQGRQQHRPKSTTTRRCLSCHEHITIFRVPLHKTELFMSHFPHMSEYIAHLRQECHNSKSVIFQEKILKDLKCYNFLWGQRRHNCSPAASSTNCVMTLYLLNVHLQTFLSIPKNKKCQILSCDTHLANEPYVVWRHTFAHRARPTSRQQSDDMLLIFNFFYWCTVHFDNIKILFTNKCTFY
jgi:hypothetical protein